MTDATLIQRIKDLTARFGKGWHDGIQIDASDIADLCLAADALEQQAADLAYVKAASVFNLMEENKRQAAQIEALRAALDAETARWEEAMRLTWKMVDPFNPAGQPGSYWRGQDAGIVAALTTLRANLKPPNVAIKPRRQASA